VLSSLNEMREQWFDRKEIFVFLLLAPPPHISSSSCANILDILVTLIIIYSIKFFIESHSSAGQLRFSYPNCEFHVALGVTRTLCIGWKLF